MPHIFRDVEAIEIGDLIAGNAEVVAIRSTPKTLFFTAKSAVSGEEFAFRQAKGTKLLVNVVAAEPTAEEGGESEVPRCVNCGERPWGYGYCGEECSECAKVGPTK